MTKFSFFVLLSKIILKNGALNAIREHDLIDLVPKTQKITRTYESLRRKSGERSKITKFGVFCIRTRIFILMYTHKI